MNNSATIRQRVPLPSTAPRQNEQPKPQSQPTANQEAAPKQYREPDLILWQRASRNGFSVRIELATGRLIEGKVLSYGQFTVLIEVYPGNSLVVFKHSIVVAGEVPTGEAQG